MSTWDYVNVLLYWILFQKAGGNIYNGNCPQTFVDFDYRDY